MCLSDHYSLQVGIMYTNNVEAALATMSSVLFALQEQAKHRQNQATKQGRDAGGRFHLGLVGVLAVGAADEDGLGAESGVEGLEGAGRVDIAVGDVI